MNKVILVTDPLCSWCWAIAPQFRETMERLGDRVAFDFMLGGINVTATRPLGDLARSRFTELWRRVTDVTGQTFGRLPSSELVYNSTRPCVAIHAARQVRDAPPFDYLHDLQARFFSRGEDITDVGVLIEGAESLGIDAERVRRGLADAAVLARTIDEFAISKSYGTHALPSVLIETRAGRRLFSGGWMNADTLVHDLDAWFAREGSV